VSAQAAKPLSEDEELALALAMSAEAARPPAQEQPHQAGPSSAHEHQALVELPEEAEGKGVSAPQKAAPAAKVGHPACSAL
jgi:hypothetical protein